MENEDVLSEEGLWQRVAEKKEVALLLRAAGRLNREAWMASGFGVEFALKARIMRVRQLNAWPSRSESVELYHHNLRTLVVQASIDLTALPDEVRAAFRVVLDWERNHDYNARHMAAAVAEDMVEAAFGENGVVEWLRNL